MRRVTAYLVLLVSMLLTLAACDTVGSDEQTSAAVRVKVVGRLVSATGEQAGGFEGVHVEVKRASTRGERKPYVDPVQAAADGTFSIEDVSLSVWEETYVLEVSDPQGRWQGRSLALFALTAGTLDYKDIALTPQGAIARSTLRGNVLDALTFEPIAGASVALRDGPEEVSATTMADGSFSVRAPAGRYQLELSAPGKSSATAPDGWVSETGEQARLVAVSADPETLLGRLLMVPTRQASDVTVIFSADHQTGDLRLDAATKSCENRVLTSLSTELESGFAQLTLPRPELDLNHAWDLEVERWDARGPLRPDGFGIGTSFWPGFLGTPADSGSELASSWYAPRVTLGKSLKADAADAALRVQRYDVAKRNLVELRTKDLEDQRVEAMVLHATSPAPSFPKKLGYYYETSDADDATRRFPTGIMMASARVDCWMQAELRVYQGDALLRRFTFERADGQAALGEETVWSPLVVEYGYTQASPETDAEVYLRPFPFADLELGDAAPLQAYQAAEATSTSFGWDPLPKSINKLVGTKDSVFFGGADPEGTNLWEVRRNEEARVVQGFRSGPQKPGAIFAMSERDSRLLMAYERGGDTKIELAPFSDEAQTLASQFDTVTCGTPRALGRLRDSWIVGTEKGLFPTSCTGAVSSFDNYFLRRDTPMGNPDPNTQVARDPVSSLARFRSWSSQGDWTLVGTTNANAQGANITGVFWDASENFNHWNSLFGLGLEPSAVGASEESVIGAVTAENDLVLAMTKRLYFDFRWTEEAMGVPPTLQAMVEVGGDSGALTDLVDVDGKKVPSEITALGSFQGQAYFGTGAGLFTLDLREARPCIALADTSATPACGDACRQCLRKQTIKPVTGFPAVEVLGMAAGADRFFVLSDRGLFELLATRVRLPDPTTPPDVGDTLPDAGLTVPVPNGSDAGMLDGGAEDAGALSDGGANDADAGSCPSGDFAVQAIVNVDDVSLPGYDFEFGDETRLDDDTAPTDEKWGLNAYGSSGPANPSSGENLANRSSFSLRSDVGRTATPAGEIGVPFDSRSTQHVRLDYTIAPFEHAEEAVDLSTETFSIAARVALPVAPECTLYGKVIVFSTDAAGTAYNAKEGPLLALSTEEWTLLTLALSSEAPFDGTRVNQIGLELSLSCTTEICRP